MTVWAHSGFSQRATKPPSAAGTAGQDRVHHLQLCVAHVSAVGLKPSGAEVAEDVRDFESRALHGRARLLRRLVLGPQWSQPIKWERNVVCVVRAPEER